MAETLYKPETTEDVLERVCRYWTINEDHLPLPKLTLLHEGHPEGLQVRSWRYHYREDARSTPLRCDINAKCRGCGATIQFGIAVPEIHYRRFAREARYYSHDVGPDGNPVE